MIDKKPAVGRYLCKDTIYVSGFTSRGGIITKIKGKRIYFDCIYGGYNGTSTWIENEYVMKYTAICDTEEEFNMLQKHSWKCMEDWKQQKEDQKKEFDSFFTKEN